MQSGVTKIEALADAIGNVNGMADPSSDAYQLRNPLLLRAYSLSGRKQCDQGGMRIFETLQGGYRAAVEDLAVRCNGKGRQTDARRRAQDRANRLNGGGQVAATGPEEYRQEYMGGKLIVHMRLTPDSPLGDLLGYYGLGQPVAVKRIVNFLRRALWDDNVTQFTPLNYFIPQNGTAPESEAHANG